MFTPRPDGPRDGSRARRAALARASGHERSAAAADASSQPSAMERLRRQEDARKAELARFAAAKRQNDAATMRDVRERAMLERPSIAPTAPVEPTTRPGVVDEFDWGAAALGLGAGVAATCALLGVFRARSQSRSASRCLTPARIRIRVRFAAPGSETAVRGSGRAR